MERLDYETKFVKALTDCFYDIDTITFIEYKKCEWCGQHDEGQELENGRYICNICKKHETKCDGCETPIHDEDETFWRYDANLCEGCYESGWGF